jgi:hypothetical protein
MIRALPSAEGEAVSELLPGERFAVLEYAGGWAWGFAESDHLVGYVDGIALVDPVIPTHYVCEREAPVSAEAEADSPVIATLPMGALLHGHEAGACLVTEYGCVSLSHLRRVGEREADPATVAERLLNAPFLPGGRTAAGVDDTALVQLALSLCGVPAPRLLDQLRALGEPVADESARRGDLILFQDSAGLMIDDLLMIHASRAAGKVVVEPAAPEAAQWRRLPL